jgi:hypothetical protein
MIGRFSFDNRILRPINGLRYTRQPSYIFRVSTTLSRYEATGGWGLSEGVMAEGCMFPTRPLSPEM